jgi:hypothetical protein
MDNRISKHAVAYHSSKFFPGREEIKIESCPFQPKSMQIHHAKLLVVASKGKLNPISNTVVRRFVENVD